MAIDIKIPSVGESVQEAVLAEWFKKDGDTVQKDEALLVIETDKVTLEVVAEAGGVLKILIKEGETVAIGAVVGQIETAGAAAKRCNPGTGTRTAGTCTSASRRPLRQKRTRLKQNRSIPAPAGMRQR